ncbi:hypothetical protein WG66_004080 [Moniliophthora roreri]|nr:hypothetical protein WG66_004080 [Moniliophthora roreri]
MQSQQNPDDKEMEFEFPQLPHQSYETAKATPLNRHEKLVHCRPPMETTVQNTVHVIRYASPTVTGHRSSARSGITADTGIGEYIQDRWVRPAKHQRRVNAETGPG